MALGSDDDEVIRYRHSPAKVIAWFSIARFKNALVKEDLVVEGVGVHVCRSHSIVIFLSTNHKCPSIDRNADSKERIWIDGFIGINDLLQPWEHRYGWRVRSIEGRRHRRMIRDCRSEGIVGSRRHCRRACPVDCWRKRRRLGALRCRRGSGSPISRRGQSCGIHCRRHGWGGFNRCSCCWPVGGIRRGRSWQASGCPWSRRKCRECSGICCSGGKSRQLSGCSRGRRIGSSFGSRRGRG
mmetsp:Transcript_21062/g.42766  ORF Transcript_21062/g.42766 Transcript_21062/m.42766 type:complete len:240 (-) Transcript_21062:218-937(-)